MGAQASKDTSNSAAALDGEGGAKKNRKGPLQVLVERPRVSDRAGKPVLAIPNSTYRVMYVDPSQRGNVVGRHGYIALRTDGKRAFGEEDADAEGDEEEDGDIDREGFEAALPGHRPMTGDSAAGADELDLDSEGGHSASRRGSQVVPAEEGGLEIGGDSSSSKGEGGLDQHGGTGVSRRSGTAGGRQLDSAGSGELGTTTGRHQQFVYPAGRYAQTRIYFEDSAFPEDYDQEHDGTNEEVYEHEEEQLYEMGGVTRIVPRPFEPTEEDLSYELPSKVLDALRMAIEAPMEAFSAKALTAGQVSEEDALAEFKRQAMDQLALARDADDDRGPDDQQVVVLAPPTIDHQMTAEEAELRTKNKRRKALHKKVNAWKDAFKEQNGRRPTAEEMHNDEEFGPMYREYLALKRDLKVNATGAADEDGGGGGTTSAASPQDPFGGGAGAEQEEPEPRPPAHLPKAAINNLDAQLSPSADRRRSLAPIDSARRGSDVDPSSPLGRLRALPDDRRAQIHVMVRQVRKWKKEFRLMTGNDATKADIVNDHTISDTYLELRHTIGDDDCDVSDDEVRQKRQQERASLASLPLASRFPALQLPLEEQYDRRKKLGRELNEWKAEFATTNDRKPTMEDIEAVPSILDLYEEYSALPKPPPGHSSEAAGSASSPHNGTDPHAALLKRKKQLGKKLNAWKTAWADAHNGNPPLESDIEADVEMAPLFQEYQDILAQLGSNSAVRRGSSEPATKRKKQLGKELTAWKNAFAEEHGREPTSDDIDVQPDVKAMFDEYQMLKEAANAQQQQQQDAAESPEHLETHNATLNATLPDASTSQEMHSPKRRRKQLGKELNAWKKSFEEASGRPPTQDDIESDPMMGPKYKAYVELTDARADQSLGGTLSSDKPDPKKRKKQVGKELNAWKKAFEDMNGQKPTSEDMAADPTISALYAEYMLLKDVLDPGAGTPQSPSRPSTSSNIAKRRKQIGKELNVWKKEFEAANGHAPSTEDIEANADIAVKFAEYQRLKEMLEMGDRSQELGATNASSAPDAAAAARGSAGNLLSVGPSAEDTLRRKRLGKELNAWKKEFEATNGRKPAADDIAANPEMQAKFEEYQKLKLAEDGLGTESMDVSVAPTTDEPTDGDVAPPPPPPVEPEDGTSIDDAAALHKRRKKLGKQLNEWKKRFKEEHNRAPKDEDLKANDEIRAIYEEYVTIPKEGGSSAAPPPQDADLDGDPQATDGGDDGGGQQLGGEEKARKRMLAHQLNQWKAAFAAENERQPGHQDILADADIAPIYEEYLLLSKRI